MFRNKNWKWLCKYNHRWEFDGGQWVIKDASITTRKCTRCGLKQDIAHYHIGGGISYIDKERNPGDPDYDKKFEMNERPL